MDNDEDFYGFGLQFHSVNHAGRKRLMKVNSDPAANTGETHAPVPFYVSTSGYGVLVDTFRYTTFHMGTNGVRGGSRDTAEPVKEHVAFSEKALYALKRASDTRKVIIDIPTASGVDVYFFEGPGLLDAVSRYNRFSGGGCLPPLWGLGMWYRVYGGSDQAHVLKLAELFREESFPVDVLGFEPRWHSHSYSCSYKWNPALFPQPEEMINKLKENHYHPKSMGASFCASHCGDL